MQSTNEVRENMADDNDDNDDESIWDKPNDYDPDKDYKYDASDKSREEIKEQIEKYREENPSATLVDDGGAKITNDEDTIAEAQRRGEFSNPDEHEEEQDEDASDNK